MGVREFETKVQELKHSVLREVSALALMEI